MSKAGIGPTVVQPFLYAVVIAVGGLQVMYAFEQSLQFVYWLGSPGEPPWVAPWTRAMASFGGRLQDSQSMSFGGEVFPLIITALELLGVAALAFLIRAITPERGDERQVQQQAAKTTRLLLWVQALLFAEHSALILTLLRMDHSIGISTLFGLMPPGPALWTYRIWWYFLTSAAVTVLFVQAIRQYLHVRTRTRPIA